MSADRDSQGRPQSGRCVALYKLGAVLREIETLISIPEIRVLNLSCQLLSLFSLSGLVSSPSNMLVTHAGVPGGLSMSLCACSGTPLARRAGRGASVSSPPPPEPQAAASAMEQEQGVSSPANMRSGSHRQPVPHARCASCQDSS